MHQPSTWACWKVWQFSGRSRCRHPAVFLAEVGDGVLDQRLVGGQPGLMRLGQCRFRGAEQGDELFVRRVHLRVGEGEFVGPGQARHGGKA
jgi:hypothetical protein